MKPRSTGEFKSLVIDNRILHIMGHHYVPQYYLHGFADEGRLWGHDRIEGRSFPTQPKVVAHECGMYPEEVERYLAYRIETPAQEAIDRVRNLLPLDEADRIALANYIIALWKRVPEGRRRVAERMPEVAASVRDEVLSQLDKLAAEDPSLSTLVGEKREQVLSVIRLYEDDPPPDIWHRSLHTAFTPRVVDSLLSMKWRYLYSDTPSLLASDNPVFFFAHEGIGQATSELTLPLSSTVALWASRRASSPQIAVKATPVAIRELNRRAAFNATRFVFSMHNDAWILPFHRKGKWALNRLL